jgi:hypothetical protein
MSKFQKLSRKTVIESLRVSGQHPKVLDLTLIIIN